MTYTESVLETTGISTEGFPFIPVARYGGKGKNSRSILLAFKQGYMTSVPTGSKKVEFLVKGRGLIDTHSVAEYQNSIQSHAYRIWYGILSRIGKGDYKDVGISNDWRIFSNFKRFHDKWYRKGYVIDKDLLSGETKVYSAETCTYVPPCLNNCIREFNRNSPIGVFFKGGKYRFNVSDGYGNNINVSSISLNEIAHLYSLYRCVRIQSYAGNAHLRPEARERLVKMYDYKTYLIFVEQQLNEKFNKDV